MSVSYDLAGVNGEPGDIGVVWGQAGTCCADTMSKKSMEVIEHAHSRRY